ncbi:MAG: hypothetical protein AAGF86_08965, partial [Pseudomonadota bacterium]
RNVFRWTIFLAVSVVVVSNAAAKFLQTSHPKLAQVINPLNSTARVNQLTAELSKGSLLPDDLKLLNREVKTLVGLSPRDARGYSLLAETARRSGNEREAKLHYLTALVVAPTEINALLNRLRSSAVEGELAETVARLDVILRRWPRYFDNVKPALLALAGKAQGGELLRRKLAERPAWRWPALLYMMQSEDGARLAKRLLADERASGQEVNVEEVAQTIKHLIAQKTYFEAYRLFLLTLNDEERERLSFVFNPDFRLKPDRRLFNWQLKRQVDADVSLPYRPADDSGGGLSVRFLGTPAKLGNVYQMLSLPKGLYRFSASVSGRNLKLPKGLFWEIYCSTSGEKLGTAPFEPGSYRNQPISESFSVPAKGCPLQTLRLRTGLQSSSWSARYHGTAIVHEVSVEKQI